VPCAPSSRVQNQKFPSFQKNGGGAGGSRKKMKGNFGFASAASLLQKRLIKQV